MSDRKLLNPVAVAKKQAKEKVRNCKKRRAVTLSLNDCGLTHVPEDLHRLSWLEKLDLSGNKLSAFTPKCGRLTNLQELNLGRNNFCRFPTEIFAVTTLCHLDVRENSIDTIPPGISALKRLKSLNIQDNKLSSLPPEIGQLVALNDIDYSGNFHMPPYFQKILNAMKFRVTEINLSGVQMKEIPASIGSLSPHLEQLVATDNDLSSLPSFLFTMKKLRVIELRNNKLKSVTTDISLLFNLEVLGLMKNKLSNLPIRLSGCKRLVHIALSENDFQQFPMVLCDMPWLKEIFLSSNRIDLLPSELTNIKCLEAFHIDYNLIRSVSNVSWKELTCLRSFSIEHNQISDLPLSSLMTIFNLKVFRVGYNNLKPYAQKICDCLGREKGVLDLSQHNITEFPSLLLHLTDLDSIIMRNNAIEVLPPAMSSFRVLRVLDLENNRLQDEGIAALPSSITLLNLSGNQLSRMPESIAMVSSLKELQMQRNGIANILPQLMQLDHLTRLDLSYNNLSCLDDALCSLQIQTLVVAHNAIELLPKRMEQMTSLTTLDIANNMICDLSSLLSVPSITRLDASQNKVRAIPSGLLKMRIRHLSLRGNELPEMDVRVYEAEANETTVLDLGGLGLGAIPNFILDDEFSPLFSITQELDLSCNDIKQVSAEIGRMSSLKKLLLKNNSLTSLPDELAELKALRELDCEGNCFPLIPPCVADLQCLEVLSFDKNALAVVGAHVSRLTALRVLSLRENEVEMVESLPLFVRSVELSYNRIAALPREVYDLKELEELYINHNVMRELPTPLRDFGSMSPKSRSKLRVLQARHNQLCALPVENGGLRGLSLTELDLSGNCELVPSPEENALPHLSQLTVANFEGTPLSFLSDIRRCITQRLPSLVLSGRSLKTVPGCVAECAHVTSLYLNDNELHQIPLCVAKLHQLTEIDISNNKFTEFPPVLVKLQRLTCVSLEHNSMSFLPGGLLSLQSLQTLKLKGNDFPPHVLRLFSDIVLKNRAILDMSNLQLTMLPEEVLILKTLGELDLSDNSLQCLPDRIVELRRLRVIDLSRNHLITVPEQIVGLSSLREIRLEDNMISQFPVELNKIANLEVLNLARNQIREVPDEVVQFQMMREINLEGNLITDMPYDKLQCLFQLSLVHTKGNPLKSDRDYWAASPLSSPRSLSPVDTDNSSDEMMTMRQIGFGETQPFVGNSPVNSPTRTDFLPGTPPVMAPAPHSCHQQHSFFDSPPNPTMSDENSPGRRWGGKTPTTPRTMKRLGSSDLGTHRADTKAMRLFLKADDNRHPPLPIKVLPTQQTIDDLLRLIEERTGGVPNTIMAQGKVEWEVREDQDVECLLADDILMITYARSDSEPSSEGRSIQSV